MCIAPKDFYRQAAGGREQCKLFLFCRRYTSLFCGKWKIFSHGREIDFLAGGLQLPAGANMQAKTR